MKKLLKQVVFIFVCLIAVTGQATADALADANRVYDEGDYPKAAKLYTPLAKNGNAEAQYVLGMMYRAGRGVTQDYQEARKWYRLASEQGHPIAQFYLGWIYAGGKGVPKDRVKAHMWLDLAIANASEEVRKEFIVDREAIEQAMTADEIAKAQALAKKCTAKKFKGC